MQIFIGSDHRGFKLAEQLFLWAKERSLPIESLGDTVYNKDDDYFDFSDRVAEKVMEAIVGGHEARGIVICGSGVGVDIVANKKRYIRCCLGFNEEQVRRSRNDDDVNMLALPSDFIDIATAKILVSTFLDTPFSFEERHSRRITKIENMKMI